MKNVGPLAARALEDMIQRASGPGCHVHVVVRHAQVADMLEREAVLDLLRPGHRHGDRLSSLRAAAAHLPPVTA